MSTRKSIESQGSSCKTSQDEYFAGKTSDYLNKIQVSLENNQDCRSNIFKPTYPPFYTKKGCMPSKDKEIIVLLSESSYGNRFYAHVFKNIENDKWISLIAWMPSVIATAKKNEIFKIYTSFFSNLEYAPCVIQDENQGFKENKTFDEACASIANMISVFESKERMYDNEGDFYSVNPNSSLEMRIYNVYF